MLRAIAFAALALTSAAAHAERDFQFRPGEPRETDVLRPYEFAVGPYEGREPGDGKTRVAAWMNAPGGSDGFDLDRMVPIDAAIDEACRALGFPHSHYDEPRAALPIAEWTGLRGSYPALIYRCSHTITRED